MKITIKISDLMLTGELNNSETARAIFGILPLKQPVNRWGDEIYFNVPLKINLSTDAKEEVEKGDMAYWPVSPAFCIFFGKTPVSTGDKPRAYSPVNVFGRIKGDLSGLNKVKDGDEVLIDMW